MASYGPRKLQMSDFRLKVSVRNARLLNAIESRYPSCAAAARAIGVGPGDMSRLVAMRVLPYRKSDGEWTPLALKISAAVSADPADLWPEHTRDIRIRKSAEMTVSLDDVKTLVAPDKTVEHRQLIDRMSDTLTAREVKVVSMRATDATFDEIGDALGGLSRERVRQIEAKAYRKMKNQARIKLGIRNQEDVFCE